MSRNAGPVTKTEMRGHDAEIGGHVAPKYPTGVAPASTWCFEGWNRNQPYKVRGNVRVDDKDCMRDLALAGAGIVHIASWLVSESIAVGRLVALFPDIASPYPKGTERAIHAVRMRGRSHDAKARLFIDHLRSTFGDVPYWDRVADDQ